jgi:hypothetical protein
MKTIILLFFLLTAAILSVAQDRRLIGTWGITECAYVSASGTEKIMVEEIKNGTAITDYFIYETGKYKMTSNMAGTGTMDSYEGDWKTANNQLIMTINMKGQTMELAWKYKIKADLLILSRENPLGTMSIVNTYKKK